MSDFDDFIEAADHYGFDLDRDQVQKIRRYQNSTPGHKRLDELAGIAISLGHTEAQGIFYAVDRFVSERLGDSDD